MSAIIDFRGGGGGGGDMWTRLMVCRMHDDHYT